LRNREGGEIAEMERESELRNRERGIRDLGVERVEAFGQKTNFIYYHMKGIGIPLLFEWNTYSSSQGNSYSVGITIPLNNIQPNKGIAIP